MSVPAHSASATSTMAARAADAWLAARDAGASRDEIEAATIRRALTDAHGELKGAARRLGIQRDALRRAMKRLGLPR